MDLTSFTSHAGLGLAAFVAATPLPMNSEVVLLALLATGAEPIPLIVIATLANTAGSCLTYWCGSQAERLRGGRWFPFTDAGYEKAKTWFHRWGQWSLLLSWAPGGDFLVALAGAMRVPVPAFLALTFLAKALRYIAVTYAALYLTQ